MDVELNNFKGKIVTAGSTLAENINVGFSKARGYANMITDVNPDPEVDPTSHLSSLGEFLTDGTLQQAARDGDIECVKENLKKLKVEGTDALRVLDVLDSEGFSALHHAARYNRQEIVKILIDCDAFIDVRGEDSNTPLHMAARYNSLETAKVLIQCGAEINLTNTYGSTPLHFAARRGNSAIARILINQPEILVNIKDNGDVTPLHQAAISGDIEIVQMLIKAGANYDARDNEGEGPLHFAAGEGNADVIEMLIDAATVNASREELQLKRKTYVNSFSNEFDTALHLACQGGYSEAVKVLIDNGADVNTKADNKNVPLHLAAVGGHLHIAEMLLLQGAKVNARNDDQMTPLQKAALFGRKEMAEYLIQKGAKINLKDEDGYTPLLSAVERGQTETARFLVSKKAKLHLSDSNMKTCLHIAVENNHISTLEMLLDCGAAGLLNVVDKDYRTPLHCAAAAGQIKAIELLIENGGKADLGANDERTPMHMAALNGKKKSVIILGKAAPHVLDSTDDRGRTPLHLAALTGSFRVVDALLTLGAEIDGRDDVFWTPLDYAARYGFYKTLAILLNNDAPVDASDKNRNTPLHHASANGHVMCVDLLLDYGANIAFRNLEGKNCLDLAIENFEQDVCMALVTHKRWVEAVENTDSNGRQPMEKLIAVAPQVAEVVLNKCMEESKHPSYHVNYNIIYTFKYLQTVPGKHKGVQRPYFGPRKMVSYKRERLLSHRVTRMFIEYKWKVLGRIPYFFNLLSYMLFVALVTAFAIIERKSSQKNPSDTKTTTGFTSFVPWMTSIMCILSIIKEIVQLATLGRKYFKDAVNYLEIILYIFTLVFMMPFLASLTNHTLAVSNELRWTAGAICLLISWINLLLYLQRYPFFGLVVVMFVEILKTVIKVLTVLSLFIIAFALAFYILMTHQKTFSKPELSIMKSLVMTIGELEYDDVFTNNRGANNTSGFPLLPYATTTYILFAIFLILLSIIVMNLLVGLAVGDIEAVRKTAYVRILEQQVDLLEDFESSLPSFLLKNAFRPTYVHYPNALPWFDKIRHFFGFSEEQYEFLKTADSESSNKDSEILEELENNKHELKKQKERLKKLTVLVEDQNEIIKQMASKLGITCDEEN